MKKLFVVLVLLVAISVNAQWVQMSNGMGINSTVLSLSLIGTDIFAGTDNGIYKSTNNGTNWVQIAFNNKLVKSLATIGNNIFAATDSYVYLSTDNGSNWIKTAFSNNLIHCLATLGTNIFAGTIDYHIPSTGGIYRSTNNGSNWTYTPINNSSIVSFVTLGTNIFAGTDSNASGGGRIFLSTNNGLNWTQTGFGNKSVWSLMTNGNNIFAGTYDYQNNPAGVFVSTNNGTNWSQTALNNKNVLALATLGNNIFAGTYNYFNPSGIYFSNNNGMNWSIINQGFDSLASIRTLLITNTYIFAGTEYKSVWRRPLSDFTNIQNISTEIPSSYSLSQNYPNPFNPTTKIKFSIVSTQRPSNVLEQGSGGDLVQIKVYDVTSREVQTLVNESLNPGTYEVSFDGSRLTAEFISTNSLPMDIARQEK